MYLIPKIFVNEEIEHDGTYVKIPRRPIHPKPKQTPHPPLYYACTREATLQLAGSRGIGALVLGFSGPDEIARKNAIYREHFRNRKPEDQVGYRPTEHLAALCAACVLEDRDEARRIGLRGQRFFAEAIAHWYQGGPKPTVDEELSAEEHAAVLARGKEQVITYLSEEKITAGDEHTSNYTVAQDAYGTPEDCIRYVTRLQEAGAGDHGDHPQYRGEGDTALSRLTPSAVPPGCPGADTIGRHRTRSSLAGTNLCSGVPAKASRSRASVSSFGATPVRRTEPSAHGLSRPKPFGSATCPGCMRSLHSTRTSASPARVTSFSTPPSSAPSDCASRGLTRNAPSRPLRRQSGSR
jgi:hypothetical protein